VKFKLVINRGKWITGAGLFNYAFGHLDDIFVGRILGTRALGIYQQAYKISTLPVSEVGDVFNKVTFPVYVNISENKRRLVKAFIKTTLAISVLMIPFALILLVYPKEIVLIVLGENWLETAAVLRVLVVFAIFKAVSNSAFSVFLALKKQEIVTIITLVGLFGLAVSLYPLINRFGLIGAGYSTIIGTVLSIFPTLYYLRKTFKGQ